jgi:hypothetical protein
MRKASTVSPLRSGETLFAVTHLARNGKLIQFSRANQSGTAVELIVRDRIAFLRCD